MVGTLCVITNQFIIILAGAETKVPTKKKSEEVNNMAK
jgi:hypothetical protein